MINPLVGAVPLGRTDRRMERRRDRHDEGKSRFFTIMLSRIKQTQTHIHQLVNFPV